MVVLMTKTEKYPEGDISGIVKRLNDYSMKEFCSISILKEIDRNIDCKHYLKNQDINHCACTYQLLNFYIVSHFTTDD